MIDNTPFALTEHLPTTLDEIEAIGSHGSQTVGTPTGFTDLDALLGGLRPGLVHTVFAASGVGSSLLALNFARTAALHHDLTTLYLSGQAPANEITMRILSAEARIPLNSMRFGLMVDEEWTRLARCLAPLSGHGEPATPAKPLFIRTAPGLPWVKVLMQCQSLKQENDLRLVVIDGADMFARPADGESRRAAQGRLSADIKAMAVELGVAVVVTISTDRRGGRWSMLPEVVAASPYTADSDIAIGLYREDAYERESPRAGEADLLVLKNRFGPVATVTVAFQGHYARFVDMAHPEPAPSKLRPVPGEDA